MRFDLPKILGSEVMREFGTSFSRSASNGGVEVRCRESVGFNGPIMVEAFKVGATAVETTANALRQPGVPGKRAGRHVSPYHTTHGNSTTGQ
jgi:hypothetical protein